jgi:hypothetical protein
MMVPREAVPNAAVPILLQLLDLPNNANREEALDLLCELVGGAWGAEGEALGVAIRDAGGISTITNLLETDEEMIQQALFLIANLASDAVDAQSALTKRQLLAIGAAPKLLTCLSSPETEVIAYAAAVPGDKKKVAYITSYTKLGLVYCHLFSCSKATGVTEMLDTIADRKTPPDNGGGGRRGAVARIVENYMAYQ